MHQAATEPDNFLSHLKRARATPATWVRPAPLRNR